VTGGAPVVTALRRSGHGRVAVELDGQQWRVLPIEPVLAAGLATGVVLDRPRARRLRGELRRADALRAGLTALRFADHTQTSLNRRLERSGIAPAQRDAVIETLERAGLVDDARVAYGRARGLAARGAGNQLIRADLESRGVSAELAAQAIASLETEAERVGRVLAAEGRSARVLRRLAAKGFSEDVLEELVADGGEAEVR
jgi:SOS response regulatory protein OraA/RecX